MRQTVFLCKRKMKTWKAQTLILLVVIALVTSTVCTVFSMCDTYGAYFMTQPAVSGMPATSLVANGMRRFGELVLAVFQGVDAADDSVGTSLGGAVTILFRISSAVANGKTLTTDDFTLAEDQNTPDAQTPEIPDTLPADADMFSMQATAENAAAAIIVTLAVTTLSAYLCLSVLFAVYRKQNRRFYAGLIVSGASAAYVRKCMRLEGMILGAIGILSGAILGAAETGLLRVVLRAIYDVRTQPYALGALPWQIRPSARMTLAAIVLLSCMTLRLRAKDCRRLSTEHSFAQSRAGSDVSIGISLISKNSAAYKRSGVGRLVGRRLFSDAVMTNVRIFLLTVFSVSTSGISMLICSIVRNYNHAQWTTNVDLQRMVFCMELFFCAVSAAMFVTVLVGATAAVYSAAEKNAKYYAQMRSVGASLREVRRAIRAEASACMLCNAVFGVFLTIFFAVFFTGFYPGAQTTTQGGSGIVWFVGGQIACILIAMRIAEQIAVRRAQRRDVISVLKA